ncbi:futalosine hydrolase [Flavihumibacter fluvii]|uniref:futalosine hydrolase n=1 Tax=Flavihumibacter fluvii TaxID=2838157 RepID=UPI001BDEB162|nr:futalosine hydrolase [Flavihumibacter fluvii]ULQ53006.1 futalosine hydrolase [Flavihumibacter fluvii]
MHCLLVAATAAEIAPFTEHLATTEKLNHIDFDIDILITGVGSNATTYHLTRYLQHKRPDLVIQAGVAGALDPETTLGTVFAVTHDVFADQGVLENGAFQDIFDLKLAPPNVLPYKKGVLPNPYSNLVKRTRLKKAKAVTVNEITTQKKTTAYYSERYGARLESMEGASLHFVCLLETISFLQVRSISNHVGIRNKKKWNLPLAIGQLNKELIRLLESL